jgi:hypothetical protein
LDIPGRFDLETAHGPFKLDLGNVSGNRCPDGIALFAAYVHTAGASSLSKLRCDASEPVEAVSPTAAPVLL